MANEFVIKNGYFSQGNSNVTGSLQVTGSVGVTGSVSITQDVTASKALFSSSNGNQLTVMGSGSTVAQVYGSQGNLLVINDTFSGSLFTVTDVSGYQILDITSDYYTSHIEMIGTASLTGSLSITENLEVKQNITASKALFSSSNGNQLTVMGSGSTVAQVYGSQGNLLVVNDTFSGSVFTVTDISGYPILDVTSNYYTGSVFLPMMQSQSQQHVVVYNSQSGLLTYTPSNTVGGGVSFPYTITSSAVVPIFFVSGGYYFEINSVEDNQRLFRVSYDPASPGALINMGDLSNGSVTFTVDQVRQTIEINALTASILQLTDAPQTNVVTIDTTTGQLFYTASSAIGGGGGPSTFNSTSSLLGDGSLSSFNINHGFNTFNLHITVYSASGTYENVYPDIRRVNANTASIVFSNPPLQDEFIVYISQ
jgi:hypothetical protein